MKNPSTMRIVIADGYRENIKRCAVWKGGESPKLRGRSVRISVPTNWSPTNTDYTHLLKTGGFKIEEMTLKIVYRSEL